MPPKVVGQDGLNSIPVGALIVVFVIALTASTTQPKEFLIVAQMALGSPDQSRADPAKRGNRFGLQEGSHTKKNTQNTD